MNMPPLLVGTRRIGPGEPVFVIAEAGVNHNGDIDLAQRLVDVASEAGADAIKFQTFKAENVAASTAPKAVYQLETTDSFESQQEMLRRLELSPAMHRELQAYCQQQHILFMSTPFDENSADLLDELDVPLFKLPSGEVNNWPFLEYVARKGKPLILSTGMSYLSEVDEALRVIYNAGNTQVIILHCVTNYPADPADVNLRTMQTMATALHTPVGYSDHTPGPEVALAAVALGACVIEKHFTLDKSLSGPDHRASLEPRELRALIAGIRTVERALGNGTKQPASSEENNRLLVRRSLVAAQDIPQGDILQPHMLKGLRPAGGISPALAREVVGHKTRQALKSGQLVTWSDLA
jgi:N,N'-diacetyllegionaminate synthase